MANESSVPTAILVADDDPSALRLFERLLSLNGYDVSVAQSGEAARALAAQKQFDAVLSDISMPGLNGLQLLQAIRVYDLDVPVLLVTGDPRLDTAVEAVQHGALRYLTKPVRTEELLEAVANAVKVCRVARSRRLVLAEREDGGALMADRAGLEAVFAQAFEDLYMAFQPVVEASTATVFAHEALLRSRSIVLSSPCHVLDAAERLGLLVPLGQRVRALVTQTLRRADRPVVIFVNLHPRDLADESLYRRDAPLSEHAHQVVLEVTERSSLAEIDDVQGRIARLREIGFRIAIDDMGAGYAGFNSFLGLRPDIVKIDMAIVRGVDENIAKQKVVSSIVELCKSLQTRVVAEGIETTAERETTVRLGVDLLQGFALGRPQAWPRELAVNASG